MNYNITLNKMFTGMSIKEMESSSRPRERFENFGAQALTNEQLLCILLGSGSEKRRVQDIAHDVASVISACGSNLPNLEELVRISGVGKTKAMQILCAVELGRRLCLYGRQRCDNPQDAFNCLRHFGSKEQEYFMCVMLNGAREIIGFQTVTVGLVNRTLVHPREVFAEAIKMRCTSVILGHNHPSGNLEPSSEDIQVTERLVQAGELLGIKVVDHIIFSDSDYFSMNERGIIT